MAQATQLLAPEFSFTLLVIFFAVISLLLQVFTSYQKYARYLKFLALILFSYVLSALLIQLDWKSIFTHTIIPSITFSKDQIFLLCAILGTTISPYLFFWQTSQEVEEGRLKSSEQTVLEKHPNKQDLRSMRIDVWSGMFVSNVVMFFIIVACGAMLYTHGITNITSAAEAAEALRPLAGESSFLLFALGIVGTGLLSVPVLAGSASYALSESNGWTTGLNKKLKKAYAFYGVIIISMLLGLLMNFVGIDPIKMLIYSAVANGLIAPVILLLIVKMSSSKTVMGKHANGPVTATIGWVTTVVLFLVSGATVISFLL
jgi:Mn2+/Fe2+ NRAMP family transporter